MKKEMRGTTLASLFYTCISEKTEYNMTWIIEHMFKPLQFNGGPMQKHSHDIKSIYSGKSELLNIAEICVGTRVLGPGYRSVIWVQGCGFHCKGCIAEDWLSFREATLMTPDLVVDRILSDPAIDGLVFSGGEPFLQPKGLATIAKLARQKRELSIICFSGFEYSQLLAKSCKDQAVKDLLNQIDLLIDGKFILSEHQPFGLRGSRNQNFIHLTNRLAQINFETTVHDSDLRISEDLDALIIGIPENKIENLLKLAIDQLNRQLSESV